MKNISDLPKVTPTPTWEHAYGKDIWITWPNGKQKLLPVEISIEFYVKTSPTVGNLICCGIGKAVKPGLLQFTPIYASDFRSITKTGAYKDDRVYIYLRFPGAETRMTSNSFIFKSEMAAKHKLQILSLK